MDIRLKGEKDGIRAAEEILQQVDASIVYLTAHSDRLTVDRASRTDHDGFILKPFHRRELQSTLAVAMLLFQAALQAGRASIVVPASRYSLRPTSRSSTTRAPIFLPRPRHPRRC